MDELEHKIKRQVLADAVHGCSDADLVQFLREKSRGAERLQDALLDAEVEMMTNSEDRASRGQSPAVAEHLTTEAADQKIEESIEAKTIRLASYWLGGEGECGAAFAIKTAADVLQNYLLAGEKSAVTQSLRRALEAHFTKYWPNGNSIRQQDFDVICSFVAQQLRNQVELVEKLVESLERLSKSEKLVTALRADLEAVNLAHVQDVERAVAAEGEVSDYKIHTSVLESERCATCGSPRAEVLGGSRVPLFASVSLDGRTRVVLLTRGVDFSSEIVFSPDEARLAELCAELLGRITVPKQEGK